MGHKVIALCALALAALAGQSIQAGEGSGFCRVRQIGGRNVFDSVVVGGMDCGRFTLMLFHGGYRDIDR